MKLKDVKKPKASKLKPLPVSIKTLTLDKGRLDLGFDEPMQKTLTSKAMKPPLYKQVIKEEKLVTPKKLRVERPEWNKSAKKLGPLYSSNLNFPSLLTNMPRSRSSVAHAITNPE